MAQRAPGSPTPPADHGAGRRRLPGVEVEHAATRPVVAVTGRVDGAKIAAVSDAVRTLIAAGVVELVVDLTRTWDGAGLLALLTRTRTDLTDRGGTLELVGVALPEYLAALTVAPLDEVFLVYDAVRRDAGGRSVSPR